jgi:hypothetical protein
LRLKFTPKNPHFSQVKNVDIEMEEFSFMTSQNKNSFEKFSHFSLNPKNKLFSIYFPFFSFSKQPSLPRFLMWRLHATKKSELQRRAMATMRKKYLFNLFVNYSNVDLLLNIHVRFTHGAILVAHDMRL